jgi:osmotically inducible protein OsmC
MKRNATAVWNGSGKEGSGHLTTQSTVLNQTQYSFNSRFADGVGTNPEELVAAAHAGCFAMKLSFILGEMGFTPESLDAHCEVTFADGKIASSHLVVKGKVPGATAEQFAEGVKNAELNCPISKSLNVAISSEAILI